MGENRWLKYQKSAGGFVENHHLTFEAAVGHILYDMPRRKYHQQAGAVLVEDCGGQGAKSVLPGCLCASHMEANTEYTRCYLTVEAWIEKELVKP
jgi:hypothetical protein